jgi:hypothetical protein
MSSRELEQGLEIIFHKEKSDLKLYNTFTKEQKQKYNEFFATYMIKDYQNSEKLKNLYFYLDNEQDKVSLIRRLEKEVIESEEDGWVPQQKSFNGLSKLCFYTLLQLNFTDEALKSFIKRKKRCNGILEILLGIDLENYFNIEQLTQLYSKVENWNPENKTTKNILLERIKNIRVQKLDQKTKNVEINQDKKTVSEKIARLGLDKKYNTLLTEIEDFLNDETHKSINAGMINNLRGLISDLVIDLAENISKEKNEKIPQLPNRQEIGNARNYLKLNLALTDEDDDFIDSFVGILHHEGGHAFLSEKEYFRLAHNIAIEISLFLLSRYKKR